MSGREESLRKAEETMRRLQHEVRTPLGQILGYSELLEEELEDRGASDLAPDLQKIRIAARRLLDLMDGRLTEDPGSPPLTDDPDGRLTEDPGSPPLTDEAGGRRTDDAGAPPLPEELHEPTLAGVVPRTGKEALGENVEPDSGEEAAAIESRSPGARVLVVDDDANNRELLVRRLRKHGFAVETASDGVGCLRRVDAGGFDAVILDVMMPGMSGLEVLERLRRSHSMSELPVILATALDSSKDAVEGLALGANDYVTKPLDFPVVIARLETHLTAHRAAREVAALGRKLEFRNAFIRNALGRDVSDDLLVEMAERPDAVALAGETRRVTALVADLKGTRALARRLSPPELHQLLNGVLSGLAEVVSHYDGRIDSMPGDALVALFGLPVAGEDDAERAVACGIAMQLELDEINARHTRAQLPRVEIGVGISTGDVLAGGYGAGDTLRYKAVGAPIQQAAVIEAAARGQEVWISEETAAAVAPLARCDRERSLPFGELGPPARVRRVLGMGGSHLISVREAPPVPTD